MNRRIFLSLMSMLPLASVFKFNKPVKKMFAKELQMNEIFTYAGKSHRKIGYSTNNTFKGDYTKVIEIGSGVLKHMGPYCPINYDWPVKDNLTWNGFKAKETAIKRNLCSQKEIEIAEYLDLHCVPYAETFNAETFNAETFIAFTLGLSVEYFISGNLT